jgi:hypothetical protein
VLTLVYKSGRTDMPRIQVLKVGRLMPQIPGHDRVECAKDSPGPSQDTCRQRCAGEGEDFARTSTYLNVYSLTEAFNCVDSESISCRSSAQRRRIRACPQVSSASC